jgi:ABC-type uncharacterized transport system substrate-binding protein
VSLSAFTEVLADLGWVDGRNVRMDLRGLGDDLNRIRAPAQELVGLQPDIIVTNGTPATTAVQRETRTIPIVFANVADPVASGIVERFNRPGGNENLDSINPGNILRSFPTPGSSWSVSRSLYLVGCKLYFIACIL